MSGVSTTPLDLIAAVPAATSSQPPGVHPEEHDEWLLDEALAETFPASDSIAVSRTRPASRLPRIGPTSPMIEALEFEKSEPR